MEKIFIKFDKPVTDWHGKIVSLGYWEPSIVYYAKKGSLSAVKHLVRKGENIDANWKMADDCSDREGMGTTALIAAAERGHHKIVEYLLEAGANPFLRDDANWKALTYAEEAALREPSSKSFQACLDLLKNCEGKKPIRVSGSASIALLDWNRSMLDDEDLKKIRAVSYPKYIRKPNPYDHLSDMEKEELGRMDDSDNKRFHMVEYDIKESSVTNKLQLERCFIVDEHGEMHVDGDSKSAVRNIISYTVDNNILYYGRTEEDFKTKRYFITDMFGKIVCQLVPLECAGRPLYINGPNKFADAYEKQKRVWQKKHLDTMLKSGFITEKDIVRYPPPPPPPPPSSPPKNTGGMPT